LKEIVGDADPEEVVFPGELGVRAEPKVVAWLPNALGNGSPQRRHDVAITSRHELSLGAQSLRNGSNDGIAREIWVHRQEGKPGLDVSTRREPILGGKGQASYSEFREPTADGRTGSLTGGISGISGGWESNERA